MDADASTSISVSLVHTYSTKLQYDILMDLFRAVIWFAFVLRVYVVFCLLFWLSVPMQSIAWRDSSPK